MYPLQLARNSFRVYPAYRPKTVGIGSSKPATLVRVRGLENGWMDISYIWYIVITFLKQLTTLQYLTSTRVFLVFVFFVT